MECQESKLGPLGAKGERYLLCYALFLSNIYIKGIYLDALCKSKVCYDLRCTNKLIKCTAVYSAEPSVKGAQPELLSSFMNG